MRQKGKRVPARCPPNIWSDRPGSDRDAMLHRSLEREAFAIKWRAAGYTYREIGAAMGISLCRAEQIIRKGLARAKKAKHKSKGNGVGRSADH